MPFSIRSFSGEFEFLSNFFPSPISYEGALYPTVEHAFAAAKTADPLERVAIRDAKTPGIAKRLGRKVALRPSWDVLRIGVMRSLLERKFAPGSELACRLLETDDRELVEGNYWGDRFWGVDHKTGVGENHLGQLLMERRAQLRELATTDLTEADEHGGSEDLCHCGDPIDLDGYNGRCGNCADRIERNAEDQDDDDFAGVPHPEALQRLRDIEAYVGKRWDGKDLREYQLVSGKELLLLTYGKAEARHT